MSAKFPDEILNDWLLAVLEELLRRLVEENK